jgi:hypothetical protein
MMRRALILSLGTCLFMLGGGVRADILLLDSIAATPANSAQGIPRPSRGMPMERVKDRFGKPSKIHPPIGNPPITRWDYADYSVFFEYRHVLTAVVHHE